MNTGMMIIGAAMSAMPMPPQAQAPVPAQQPAATCAKAFADATPRVPLERLVEPDDYPPAAARAGLSGTVAFRLNVDPAGRVETVEILESPSPAFGAATTRLLKRRARFLPAVRNCQPVTGEYEGKLRWVAPE